MALYVTRPRRDEVRIGRGLPSAFGTKYRVRQILHKTTRTDINSKTLQVAVIV